MKLRTLWRRVQWNASETICDSCLSLAKAFNMLGKDMVDYRVKLLEEHGHELFDISEGELNEVLERLKGA